MDAKICPRKKVMGKKRSQIGQFYRFFGDFSISHNFFSRIYAVLIFSYVVEMVEFYRSVYFQVTRAIQIFWPFSWNTLALMKNFIKSIKLKFPVDNQITFLWAEISWRKNLTHQSRDSMAKVWTWSSCVKVGNRRIMASNK